jgi:hypothetical protein
MPRRGPFTLQEIGPAGPKLPFFWLRRSPDWTQVSIYDAIDGTNPAELAVGDLLAGPITLPAPVTDDWRPQIVQMTRTATPNALCLTWAKMAPADPLAWVWRWEANTLLGPVTFVDNDRVHGCAMSAGRLWWVGKDFGEVGAEDNAIGAFVADEDLSNFRPYGLPITPDISLPSPTAITHTPSNVWAVSSLIASPLYVSTFFGPANAEKVVTWDTLVEGQGVLGNLTRINLGNPNVGGNFDAPGVLTNGSGWTTHNSRKIVDGGPRTLPGFVTASGLGAVTLTWAGWSTQNAERLRVTIDPGTGLALSSLSESNVADLWSPVTGASEPDWPRLLDLPAGSDRWYLFPRL